MNPVHYSSASAEWSTPQEFFDKLDAEFSFGVDLAATSENTKCATWLAKRSLEADWVALGRAADPHALWCNPPYGRGLKDWVAKGAAAGKVSGVRVVMLIPARPDTRYWHEHIWDCVTHRPRPGVEVRFVKGRLKFGGSKNSAPFPSAVVIFG